MRIKSLGQLMLVFSFVLVSYGAVNAQVGDAIKDAAGKTKDVTVDAAKKTAEVTQEQSAAHRSNRTRNPLGPVTAWSAG